MLALLCTDKPASLFREVVGITYMDDLDLRAISSVSPIGAIRFSLCIMAASIICAHVVLIPKLYVQKRRLALIVLSIFVVLMFGVISTLMLRPRDVYIAASAYVVAYTVIGFSVARWSRDPLQIRRRAAVGAACMFTALLIAWCGTFLPS